MPDIRSTGWLGEAVIHNALPLEEETGNLRHLGGPPRVAGEPHRVAFDCEQVRDDQFLIGSALKERDDATDVGAVLVSCLGNAAYADRIPDVVEDFVDSVPHVDGHQETRISEALVDAA